MNIELSYQLIGKRLRAARKKRNLTQEQIAEKVDLSAQHISGIECGSAPVSLPALVRLCNALDTTPDEILMDNLKQATPIYLRDVAEVFSDATPDELYLMLSQAKSVKEAVRAKRLLVENYKE